MKNEVFPAAAANLENKRIPECCLVTGGLGMLGSALIQMLIERGAKKVICVDINIRSACAAGTSDTDHDKIKFITADICDLSALEMHIDVVFHVAALVGPYHAHDLYAKVNCVGTQNVIALCQKYKIKALVDCSSPITINKNEYI